MSHLKAKMHQIRFRLGLRQGHGKGRKGLGRGGKGRDRKGREGRGKEGSERERERKGGRG